MDFIIETFNQELLVFRVLSLLCFPVSKVGDLFWDNLLDFLLESAPLKSEQLSVNFVRIFWVMFFEVELHALFGLGLTVMAVA